MPYLRWHWRLALMAVCTTHGVLLEDRCLACHRPLAPHRFDTAKGCAAPACDLPIHQCAYCCFELAQKSGRLMPHGTGWQTHISNVIGAGYAVIGGCPVYSHLYFDGLRFIMGGLHRARGAGRTAVFERLPPDERAARLEEAICLTQSWPNEFLTKCASLPHPYTMFAAGRSDLPWWLASVLTEHVRQTPAPLSVAEVGAIVSAVSRLSGVHTAHAARNISGIDISRMFAQPLVSDAVANELIDCLDAAQLYRRILLRDKAMFLVARELRLDVSQLLEAGKRDERRWVIAGDVAAHPRGDGRPAVLLAIRSTRAAAAGR